MDPITGEWWLQVGASSVMLSLAQTGPLGMITAALMVAALLINPAGDTFLWFGEAIGRTPGKALLAVFGLLAIPFATSFMAGAALETERPPDTALFDGLTITIAASIGVLMSTVAREAATKLLIALAVLPFVYVGIQSGASIRSLIEDRPPETVEGMRVVMAAVVLLVVLMASVLRGRISMKFDGATMVSDIMSGNSMPLLP